MKYSFVSSKSFDKQFTKLNRKLKNRAVERIEIFILDPFEKSLENHPLHGKFKNYRSINITGDIRAIYKLIDKRTAYFVAIGSHSELYV